MTSWKGRATERFDVTLDELRELRQRVDQQQLEASDWRLVGALVSKELVRAEERYARMLAKVAASAAASPHTSEPSSDPKASNDAAASPVGGRQQGGRPSLAAV